MKQNNLMQELVAEAFGTFILVLLGVGVVTNVGLAPRMASAGGWNWLTICFGWCFAVVVAVYTVGGVSGGHLNPAVTLAMAVKRGFPWAKVPAFWTAQLIGAFLGAAGVYLVFRDGLVAASLPNVWTGGPGSVFAQAFWGDTAARTATGSYSILTAAIAEVFGTAVLLWGILGAFDAKNIGVGSNLGPLFVGFAVLAVGLSLGGPSGYMINPARDLGPRIFGTLIGTQGTFDGMWWLFGPIVGGFAGGLLGIFTYDWFVTPGLERKVAEAQAAAVRYESAAAD
jgi:glycerol uptake facilitator protein